MTGRGGSDVYVIRKRCGTQLSTGSITVPMTKCSIPLNLKGPLKLAPNSRPIQRFSNPHVHKFYGISQMSKEIINILLWQWRQTQTWIRFRLNFLKHALQKNCTRTHCCLQLTWIFWITGIMYIRVKTHCKLCQTQLVSQRVAHPKEHHYIATGPSQWQGEMNIGTCINETLKFTSKRWGRVHGWFYTERNNGGMNSGPCINERLKVTSKRLALLQ